MRANTDLFLSAIRAGGIPFLCLQLIEAERKETRDMFRKNSFLANQPNLSYKELMLVLMSYDETIIKGFITGHFLRYTLLPTPLDWSPETEEDTTDSQESQSSGSASKSLSQSSSQEELEVAEIMGSDIEDGHVVYTVRWKGWDDEKDWTEEPLANLANAMKLVEKFHRLNPDAKRYGEKDRSDSLIKLSTLTDMDKKNGIIGDHIIYMHVLVDVTDGANAYLPPTTNEILHCLQKVEYYTRKLSKTDYDYNNQLEYIKKVDNQLAEYGVAPSGWYEIYNDQGKKRYLREGPPSQNPEEIKQSRIDTWIKDILPAIRTDCYSIPEALRDQPHPEALGEVGFTSKPHARKKEHATHISSVYTMYLLGAIFLVKYAGKYNWEYAPVARCHDQWSASILEQGFSTARQTYAHLGGMNTHPAGISVAGTEQITPDAALEVLSHINITKVKENIEISKQRIKDSLEALNIKEENERLAGELAEKRHQLGHSIDLIKELEGDLEAQKERNHSSYRAELAREKERMLEEMSAAQKGMNEARRA